MTLYKTEYFGIWNTVRDKPTPVDCLGYTDTCCGCIHVRMGSIMICFASFIWGVIEISQAERFADAVFPESDLFRKIFLMILMIVNISFLVVSGILMIGLIMHRNLALHIYVWGGFLFNCLIVVLTLVGRGLSVFNTGSMDKSASIKLVVLVVWCSFFFYFLSVVNSYKMMVWQ